MLKETKYKLKLVAIVIVSLVVLLLVLQNTQAVKTNLFLTFTMPNAALLFGTLIIGFALRVLAARRIVSVANEPWAPRRSVNRRKLRLEQREVYEALATAKDNRAWYRAHGASIS